MVSLLLTKRRIRSRTKRNALFRPQGNDPRKKIMQIICLSGRVSPFARRAVGLRRTKMIIGLWITFCLLSLFSTIVHAQVISCPKSLVAKPNWFGLGSKAAPLPITVTVNAPDLDCTGLPAETTVPKWAGGLFASHLSDKLHVRDCVSGKCGNDIKSSNPVAGPVST